MIILLLRVLLLLLVMNTLMTMEVLCAIFVPAKLQMFLQRDGSDGCERDAASDGFDTFVTFCYDES